MSPQFGSEMPLSWVRGIETSGARAGIKSGRPDLAIIRATTEHPVGAAVFTLNTFAAAPVHISRQHLQNATLRAVVVNSGNANACTGRQGLRDTLEMANTLASSLNIKLEETMVCSTGIIGRPLPMDKIRNGIKAAIDGGTEDAAVCILTTDQGPKRSHRTVMVGDKEVRIAGIGKGAGMIYPNMATTLGFLATDAKISKSLLQSTLVHVIDRTWNQISVDGDESTNDSVILFATGHEDSAELTLESPEWHDFVAALREVCRDLAEKIVADGEGTVRIMEVHVVNAGSEIAALTASRGIVSSNLVKCALLGSDPNWGRMVAAMGKERVKYNPDGLQISASSSNGSMKLMVDGKPVPEQELAANQIVLQAPKVLFHIDLGLEPGDATAWGCDLGYDYVQFNSAYRT